MQVCSTRTCSMQSYYDCTYNFSVYAVHCKQECCKGGPEAPPQNQFSYEQKQDWGSTVHQDVHQVVATGTQLTEIVIEVAVREDR